MQKITFCLTILIRVHQIFSSLIYVLFVHYFDNWQTVHEYCLTVFSVVKTIVPFFNGNG